MMDTAFYSLGILCDTAEEVEISCLVHTSGIPGRPEFPVVKIAGAMIHLSVAQLSELRDKIDACMDSPEYIELLAKSTARTATETGPNLEANV